jgi:hypothetical protein
MNEQKGQRSFLARLPLCSPAPSLLLLISERAKDAADS